MSAESSRGPMTLAWWRWIRRGLHLQSLVPYRPQGHPVNDATRMNLLPSVSLVHNGSSADRLNFDRSSRNSTPWWPMLASASNWGPLPVGQAETRDGILVAPPSFASGIMESSIFGNIEKSAWDGPTTKA